MLWTREVEEVVLVVVYDISQYYRIDWSFEDTFSTNNAVIMV